MNNEQIGFIVHFHLKPGCENQWLSLGPEVIHPMMKEPVFVNFFRLQSKTDPTRFVLYETWSCSKEHFLNVQMKLPYRQKYERLLPDLLVEPRRMELNWRLIRSANKEGRKREIDGEKLGFFVYWQTKPGNEKTFQAKLGKVLSAVSKEKTFVNYFLLQDEADSTRFAIYETWSGREEEFRRIQLQRPYRRDYEESLSHLLARPREVQFNWKLLESRIQNSGATAPFHQ
jgi:quinol monooxygenase YgiN